MEKLKIQHEADGERGSFFVEAEAKRIAEMQYSLTEQKEMIIEHTEVDESLKGEGIGLELLYKLVGFARDQKIKVIPSCSFAEAMFQKKEELRDVLYS